MSNITNGQVDHFALTGHSLLGPSSAKRWLTCTPSARMSESIPDTGYMSPYAAEGTAAHAFAEIRVNWRLRALSDHDYRVRIAQAKEDFEREIENWTRFDWDSIDSYVDYCVGEVERLGGNYLTGGDAIWEAERAVDFSEFVPMGKGTADFTIVNAKTGVIKAIDLKFGTGVAVDARGNEQARLYALGLACGNGPGDPLGRSIGSHADWQDIEVEWAIHQPRLNYVGEDSTTLGELFEWAEEYVKPRAEMAWRGEGELNPSEEACRFCRAAPTCRARFEYNRDVALAEFGIEFESISTEKGETVVAKVTKEPNSLTPEEVGALLPRLDAWVKWASEVQARALVMARDEGLEIPGYKLVRGRSNRGWDTSIEGYDEQVKQALLDKGFPETQIMTPPVPPQLKSVAQIEKAVGKRAYTEVVDPFVVKPLGKPTLVPEYDPRDAITDATRAEEALADFDLPASGFAGEEE